MNKSTKQKLQTAVEKSEPVKKAYHSPKMLVYGSVAKLTQNNVGSNTDGGGGGGMMTGTCL